MSFPQGPQSANWDGLDDNSNPVPAGTYRIKLLQHNVKYVWDGAIGNTSTEMSGPTVHRGFSFITDMTITGTNAFYVSGYNENQYAFRSFNTSDPQHVASQWFWSYLNGVLGSNPGNIYDRDWLYTTSDGNWVYFGCSTNCNPTNLSAPYAGCITACQVSDNGPAYFANGAVITNGPGFSFANGLYVGTQAGLSGLTVQQNGNLLAVSVAPDNRIYLLDKRLGSAITNFSVNSPGRINFSPDGSLWVISGNNVICYTNVASKPSVAVTLSGLSEPLAVAVNPTNPDIILVADGGSSQQVKAFNTNGTLLWTYGLAGGYQSNGVAVTTNKFWFSYEGVDQTFLCFAPDGSFWVGDGENHRTMHFSATRAYIEQIMYQPHSWKASLDQNNNSRVFNQFLEFNVDYTKPLAQAWTLVNNWKANVDTNHIAWNEGLYEVTTFTNGHTYALIDNISFTPAASELCELTSNQLRFTGIFPLWNFGWNSNGWTSLGADGAARRTVMNEALWYQATLSGFDTNNNPVWNAATLLASAPSGSTDPVPRCCSFGNIRATISTNNVLISFDQTLNNGWHFGGIQLGGTNWLWKAGPTANLNGCGNYENSNGLTYAGNTLQAVDRNVVFGYHGEFFRSQGEASQHMHFYDDGLFVGQFGEASNGHSPYEGALPGFAGNGHCPCLMKTTNGDYYLWVNDESAHGPQRWHFVNARNIREQIGSGSLGGTISLTNQPCSFPVDVVVANGSQWGQLSWQSVSNATSYNVRYSFNNGGPFALLAGNTTNTTYIVQGLTNGQTYFFVVTAIQKGIEGIPSEQVEVNPCDNSQTVLRAGCMSEGGMFTPVLDISSSAPSLARPSLVGAEHLTGVLTPADLACYGYGAIINENIGTQGYLIYDWGGAKSNLTNLSSAFTVTQGSGWINAPNLTREFRVDNVLGTNWGLTASAIGTINIGVNDNKFHFLTVVSPSVMAYARQFTLGILSTNGTSAQYTVNENRGYSHMFQFAFKGNITLQANATGGAGATVQAIFFDNSPLYNLPAPTGLHFVPTAP
ncbi:MAG TPA: fibronectin type III domain-containing protein [Verrucomicrobiae bacterium]|nr:fibronectin type III domain-containing protein [Verrucomicrobiae bacterium]